MGAGREALTVGALHHVEVWLPDLGAARRSWGWLLGELGWTPFRDWPVGRSWRLGATYLGSCQPGVRSGGRPESFTSSDS